VENVNPHSEEGLIEARKCRERGRKNAPAVAFEKTIHLNFDLECTLEDLYLGRTKRVSFLHEQSVGKPTLKTLDVQLQPGMTGGEIIRIFRVARRFSVVERYGVV